MNHQDALVTAGKLVAILHEIDELRLQELISPPYPMEPATDSDLLIMRAMGDIVQLAGMIDGIQRTIAELKAHQPFRDLLRQMQNYKREMMFDSEEAER